MNAALLQFLESALPQPKSRKIKIASGRVSAILPALCQNPKKCLGGGKMALRVRVDAGLPRRSAAKAGHNNIKINPVFRGMVFADRIRIKRKNKIKKRERRWLAGNS